MHPAPSIPLVSGDIFSSEPLSGLRTPPEGKPLPELDAGSIEELVPLITTIDLAGVKDRTSEFDRATRELFELSRHDGAAIDLNAVAALTRFVDLTGQLVREINSLSAANRESVDQNDQVDPNIGKMLLPFTMRAWNQNLPTGNARLLYEVCLARYGKEGRVRLPVEGWQRVLHQFFDGRDATNLYPSYLTYLKASEALRGNVSSIEDAIPEVSPSGPREAFEMGEGGAAASEGASNDRFKPQSKLGAFVPTMPLKEQKRLFGRLVNEFRDVDPLAVEEVVGQVHSKVLPKSEICAYLLNLAEAVERNLERYAASQTPGSGSGLPLLAVRNGQLAVIDAPLALSKGSDSDEQAASLLSLLASVRRTLLVIARDSKRPSELPITRKVRESLHKPFVSAGADYSQQLFRKLSENSSINAARVLMGAVCSNPERDSWIFPITDLSDVSTFAWAFRNACFSAQGRETFARLFKSSFEERIGVSRLATGAAALIERGDYSRLARELDLQIIAQDKSLRSVSELASGETREQKVYRGVALLVAVSELAENPIARERLRSQIPNLECVRDIALSLESLVGAQPYLTYLPRQILSQFGPTLESCNLNREDRELLERLVSNYRIVAKYPGISSGIQGDALFHSGVLLSGPPGVGKTYLIYVLTSVLGAKRISLQPYEEQQSSDFVLQPTSDSLNARITQKLRDVEDEARRGTTVIFEIDEAEHFLPNRQSPGISPERYATCVYLLQKINEIRIKYPNVFIVIATNHPEKIDFAGIREGRVNYEIALDFPDADQRRASIERDIRRHQADGFLNSDQLGQLVAVTEGSIFVSMAATINEYFLFETLRRQEADRSYKPNFEDLLKDFQRIRAKKDARSLNVRKASGEVAE